MVTTPIIMAVFTSWKVVRSTAIYTPNRFAVETFRGGASNYRFSCEFAAAFASPCAQKIFAEQKLRVGFGFRPVIGCWAHGF